RHRNAKGDSDDNCDDESIEHDLKTLPQKIRQLAGNRRLVKGNCNLRRIGKEDRADKWPDDFPDDEDERDKTVTEQGSLLPPGLSELRHRFRAGGENTIMSLVGNAHRVSSSVIACV